MAVRGKTDTQRTHQPRVDERPDRLQKVLAAAGIGSRRECEQLIIDGRVEVDRKIISELGTRVDPNEQKIRVDGVPIRHRRRRHFIVNKPRGVLSTNRDPQGRLRVIDLIQTDERLFTVGRLDKSSEGLLIVTNDGQLANELTHPRFGVPKTYQVLVAGSPSRAELESLEQGVHLAEGVAKAQRVKVRRKQHKSTLIELVLTEGRNREIRRLLARIGHKVLRLKRTAIGSLHLGNLPVGESRRLSGAEVQSLRFGAQRKRPSRKKASRTAQRKSVTGRGNRQKKSYGQGGRKGKPGRRSS